MANEITIDFNANLARFEKSVNKASAKLDKFERDAKRTSERINTAFSTVKIVLVAAAAAKLTEAFRGIFTEAETVQRQLGRIDSLLLSTGNSAQLTTAELDRFSRGLAKSTLASTEGVRDAVGVLLTFKTVAGDTFKRTIELAQDLAAVTGGNLRSQVLQLGKALEDPTRGLSALAEAGVSFSEAEKELIKNLAETNRLADAQTVILDKLEGQVGGAGAGEAGGLAGAVDTLAQNWSEFLEALGNRGALDAATTAVNLLNNAIEGLKELVEGPTLDELAKKLERLQRVGRLPGRSGATNYAFALKQTGEQIREGLKLLPGPEGIRAQIADIEDELRGGQKRIDDLTLQINQIPLDQREITRGTGRSKVKTLYGRLTTELQQANDEVSSLADERERLLNRLEDIELQFPIDAGSTSGPSSKKDDAAEKERERRRKEQVRSLNALLQESQSLYESLLTPQEEFNAKQERLNELLEMGAISQTTYNRALKKYKEELAAASGEVELFNQLQSVLDQVDPARPLIRQLETLEKLEAEFPQYAATIGVAIVEVESQIEKINAGLEDQKDKAGELGDVWQELGPTFSSAFEDALVEGEKLSDVLKGLEQDIIRIITRQLVTKPLGNFIGGLGENLFGAGGFDLGSLIPGFSTGGSFVVQGTPGVDQNVVAFAATPGERVTVDSPHAPRKAPSGGSTTITINMSNMSGDQVRRSADQVAAKVARAVSRAQTRDF